MSFFKNLFGNGKPDERREPAAQPSIRASLPAVKGQSPQSAPAEPERDKNLIQVFDAYGREMYITKEAWRTNVLPGSIKSNWNNPDQLYGVIVNALNDGLRKDVIDAAKHLYQIDPIPERGACVWGIILNEEGRLDEAEQMFREFIEKHGETGAVMTNLAKTYAKRGDEKRSEEILWHALEIDPNQDNGLGWYWVIHKERGGESEGQAALHRIAALPKSWRAQLWLARESLQAKNLDQAMAYYKEAFARVTPPVPADLLMQMSGDLGKAAYLPELLQLTEPHFLPDVHGLMVGNNLIKAHLDLGQFEEARQIVEQLYALKRMDWQKTLSFWDAEIAKARVNTSQTRRKEDLKISMLTGDGPAWLKPHSPAAELFPAGAEEAVKIAFLGSSVEVARSTNEIQ